jgi:DNA polymerase III subunit gamma/tau
MLSRVNFLHYINRVSYEVFARKYRPQNFDELIGQTHVSRTLKNAVAQNRLAHAYLFVGPRGIGKTSIARILAKALNCVQGPTVTPCGVCDNCREIAAGNSLDVLEIDGASNNGVEQVRELRENARYAPAKSRFKIYIIDEVHMLTSAAFNALLKTLEEPPTHVKFIFATTEPQKVLPTIVSRCQRFDLHRIPANLIAQHLQFIAGKEKITLESTAAHAIARGAEGGLRDAESMLDQLVAFCGEHVTEADVLNVFGFTSEQTVADFTEKILHGATADAVRLLHEQSEAGKDMMRLMSDLISYLRDLLVFKAKPDALDEDIDSDLRKALVKHAELVENDRLLELVDQFAEAEARMKWAPNKKLHFEVAVIKAIQSLGQATLDDVIEKLSELRDGAVAGSGDAGRQRSQTEKTGVTAPGDNKTQTAVADMPVSTAPRVNENAPANLPLAGELWQQVMARIPARGFLRTLTELVAPIGIDGRNFQVGYPSNQKGAVEALLSVSNRKQLETLLQEASGREWTVHFIAREGIQPPRKEQSSSTESSNRDRLIHEAVEMFKGKIRS